MARTPPADPVRKLEIDDRHAGQRLDNFLITVLKGVPRSHIYRIVRSGEVRVNSARVRPDRKLKVGDLVRVPPLRVSRPDVPDAAAPTYQPADQDILYEDEDLLVLNKPGGMPVHAGSGYRSGLIEGLRAHRPQNPYLELVHRLDRETSGCLLLAKRRDTLLELHRALRESEAKGITRTYLALLVGRWQGRSPLRVETGLEKNILRGGERMVQVSDDTELRSSSSIFTVRQRYPEHTLVEIELLTGRTHQARVHAAHLGLPVAGDSKYGNRGANRSLRAYGLKRMFLHAESVRFRHPRNGRLMEFTAPLPDELERVLAQLREKGNV